MAQYPGEAVDQAARGITGAIDGVGSSVVRGVEGAGASVQDVADKPFQAIGLRSSPLRVLDGPIKGFVRGGANFVSSGIIGSLEIIGRGITSGIDEIPKALTSIDVRAPSGFKLPGGRR